MFSVVSAKNVPFVVRVVRVGDKYGRDNCLTYGEGEHDRADDVLVEFYDARYPHTEFGQFVSRYYLSTLLEDGVHCEFGLCLDGGEPDWSIDADAMFLVREWLEGVEVG